MRVYKNNGNEKDWKERKKWGQTIMIRIPFVVLLQPPTCWFDVSLSTLLTLCFSNPIYPDFLPSCVCLAQPRGLESLLGTVSNFYKLAHTNTDGSFDKTFTSYKGILWEGYPKNHFRCTNYFQKIIQTYSYLINNF